MAIQDFTTWTEVDVESAITVTSSSVSWVNLDRDDDSYVYRDFGAGAFRSNWTHYFDFVFSSADNLGATVHYSLSDTVNDYQGQALAGNLAIGFYTVLSAGVRYYQISEITGPSAETLDFWSGGAFGTRYYAKSVYDSFVGANGTLYLYIYSNPDFTGLLDTLVITMSRKPNYRFAFACNTFNNATTARHTGDTRNLDLGTIGRGRRLFLFNADL